MNPIEQTSAQNFVPYAPFEILVINPDRFLKMRGMVRKLRRGRSKLSAAYVRGLHPRQTPRLRRLPVPGRFSLGMAPVGRLSKRAH
jgi:hypothetical protein